jgi:hypothetical protein
MICKKKEHVFQGPHTRLFIHRIWWRTVTLMIKLPLFVQQDSVPQYLRWWAMFVTFMTNKFPYSCIWFVGFYLLTFTDLFLHWFFYNGTSVGRYQNGITTCAMPVMVTLHDMYVYLQVVWKVPMTVVFICAYWRPTLFPYQLMHCRLTLRRRVSLL